MNKLTKVMFGAIMAGLTFKNYKKVKVDIGKCSPQLEEELRAQSKKVKQ